MKKLAIVAIAGAALGIVALMRVDPGVAPAPVERLPAVAAPAQPPAVTPERETAVDPSVLDTQEARAYLERVDFEQRARRFFADPKALAQTEREREAQALTVAIDGYERANQLSAGEAMNLRIGLVRATVDDEATQVDRIAAIVAAYHADAQRREARFFEQQQGDTAFVAYKTRESAIVAEVMALTAIPDGLTREEYLRQRLQAERVALSH